MLHFCCRCLVSVSVSPRFNLFFSVFNSSFRLLFPSVPQSTHICQSLVSIPPLFIHSSSAVSSFLSSSLPFPQPTRMPSSFGTMHDGIRSNTSPLMASSVIVSSNSSTTVGSHAPLNHLSGSNSNTASSLIPSSPKDIVMTIAEGDLLMTIDKENEGFAPHTSPQLNNRNPTPLSVRNFNQPASVLPLSGQRSSAIGAPLFVDSSLSTGKQVPSSPRSLAIPSAKRLRKVLDPLKFSVVSNLNQTRFLPSSISALFPGSKFRGEQRSGHSCYDVSVNIQVSIRC